MSSAIEKIVKPIIKAGRVVWTGQSGSSYETTIEPIGGSFYPLPGVYIFCNFKFDDLLPVYVGHTDNLERRLTVDLSWLPLWRQIVKAEAHFICTLPVDRNEETRAIALDLQLGIGPVLVDN